MLQIIPLDTSSRHHLKRLNVAWLEKFFDVEPSDVIQLSHPEKEILDKGGFVFFAVYESNICGTVSLLKNDNQTYELSKMCVEEGFQGKGIGRQLLLHAITHAQIIKARKLILFTNSRLYTAVSLYQKYGFKEVPLGNSTYARSDMKMELDL